MKFIEFFFGKWECTNTCLVEPDGLLMVFRHSITGRQEARIEFNNGRRYDITMIRAREIIEDRS